jgi:nitroreductase
MNQAVASADRPIDETLTRAAVSAGYAPSILNTQPWRWRVHPDGLELFAEPARQLAAGDTQRRWLTLSCGASLHHARVALAADGWLTRVARLPDATRPDLLATLLVTGRSSPTAAAIRLGQAIAIRHTDRRPVSDKPLAAAFMDSITAAARAEAPLHVFTPDQVMDLATAASHAAAVQADDPSVAEELAYWTGPATPEGTGLPAGVLPDHRAQTTVPGRDFGRTGTLPIGSGHDRTAVYAMLFGDTDGPQSWLRSGEALSAAWLTATTLGVSVVPLSGVIEVVFTRQSLRRLISNLGYPHLVVRLGVANPGEARDAHTSRLATRLTVDTSAERLT